jgi:hypothetical protein
MKTSLVTLRLLPQVRVITVPGYDLRGVPWRARVYQLSSVAVIRVDSDQTCHRALVIHVFTVMRRVYSLTACVAPRLQNVIITCACNVQGSQQALDIDLP